MKIVSEDKLVPKLRFSNYSNDWFTLKLDDVCENLGGDESYKESFRCYIENFKTIIEKKKSRGKSKSKIIN